jgi:predicted transcriptional regulator
MHLSLPQQRNLHGRLLDVDEERLRCVLKCALSLSEEEARVLAYLVRTGRGSLASDIAATLGRNPEVVRRALRSLYARSLVTRRPYPLRRGGRAYLYEARQSLVEAIADLCLKMEEFTRRVGSVALPKARTSA